MKKRKKKGERKCRRRKWRRKWKKRTRKKKRRRRRRSRRGRRRRRKMIFIILRSKGLSCSDPHELPARDAESQIPITCFFWVVSLSREGFTAARWMDGTQSSQREEFSAFESWSSGDMMKIYVFLSRMAPLACRTLK